MQQLQRVVDIQLFWGWGLRHAHLQTRSPGVCGAYACATLGDRSEQSTVSILIFGARHREGSELLASKQIMHGDDGATRSEACRREVRAEAVPFAASVHSSDLSRWLASQLRPTTTSMQRLVPAAVRQPRLVCFPCLQSQQSWHRPRTFIRAPAVPTLRVPMHGRGWVCSVSAPYMRWVNGASNSWSGSTS